MPPDSPTEENQLASKGDWTTEDVVFLSLIGFGVFLLIIGLFYCIGRALCCPNFTCCQKVHSVVHHKPPTSLDDSQQLPTASPQNTPDENIWKKFKRKFNAKNEISVRRHYDDYYGRKFSIELQEQSPSTLKKLDVNTFRKLDGAKRNFHADAVLANWNSPV